MIDLYKKKILHVKRKKWKQNQKMEIFCLRSQQIAQNIEMINNRSVKSDFPN